MAIDADLAIKIGGPIVGGLVSVLVKDIYERRPRLVCFYVHSGAVGVKHEGSEIRFHTHALIVANQGRDTAKNVRLGHRNLPDFEIQPPIDYEVKEIPGGSREIVIPILGPRETITVNYLYHPPLYWNDVNIYVKSDAGHAKVLNVLPTPQWPWWAQRMIQFVIAYGLFAMAYTIFSFIK